MVNLGQAIRWPQALKHRDLVLEINREPVIISKRWFDYGAAFLAVLEKPTTLHALEEQLEKLETGVTKQVENDAREAPEETSFCRQLEPAHKITPLGRAPAVQTELPIEIPSPLEGEADVFSPEGAPTGRKARVRVLTPLKVDEDGRLVCQVEFPGLHDPGNYIACFRLKIGQAKQEGRGEFAVVGRARIESNGHAYLLAPPPGGDPTPRNFENKWEVTLVQQTESQ